MSILTEIFSWWGGKTWGTRLLIWRQGVLVGTDELGNTYYEQRPELAHKAPLGRSRRWVTYRDLADPSKVPPEWHGWLHYTVGTPPPKEAYRPKAWEKPHKPNMTGTREAYRPAGSILASGQRPKVSGDYKPWKPS